MIKKNILNKSVYQSNVEILVDIKDEQKKVICITPICDKGMSFYNKLKLISDFCRGQNEVWKED